MMPPYAPPNMFVKGTRWKVEVPFGILKGITESDCRRIAAEHNGHVFRSTVRLYLDGSEFLGRWEIAPECGEVSAMG